MLVPAALAPLFLAACADDPNPVIVNTPPAAAATPSTVVTPPATVVTPSPSYVTPGTSSTTTVIERH
jgi:hypothetical protein